MNEKNGFEFQSWQKQKLKLLFLDFSNEIGTDTWSSEKGKLERKLCGRFSSPEIAFSKGLEVVNQILWRRFTAAPGYYGLRIRRRHCLQKYFHRGDYISWLAFSLFHNMYFHL